MMNVPSKIPEPEKNEDWMALCNDSRWNHQESKEDLFFGQSWNGFDGEELLAKTLQVTPASNVPDIHRGALAPKFVFENEASNEPVDDDMSVYMKRLICILCGRFVVISRPSASDYEDIENSDGVPQDGVRYWWRYWDNERNIYQVNSEKFRDSAGTVSEFDDDMLCGGYAFTSRNLREATYLHGRAPGDFAPAGSDEIPPWMRAAASITYMGKECTDCSGFFDHAWSFCHHGTTRVPLWDASLFRLAQLAGVPPMQFCRSCGNTHGILRCARCRLVLYCNNRKFCQKEDWPKHKKVCNYFKTVKL